MIAESIREATFIKDDEGGFVRVTDYTSDTKQPVYRVEAFLPGYEVWLPGDTPKMNPERSDWCHSLDEALDFFDIYTACAKIGGWQPSQLA